MTKKITLSAFLLAMLLISYQSINSNPQGAPAGHTSSPADGKNCGTSGCHGVTAKAGTGFLSSNIPSTGYIPGTSYTITVTNSGSGRKGFQVSPQNANGTLLGTLAAGSGNKIVSSKYVTHTSAPNTNPTTWTFSWTAPSKGTGTVDFYGAFVTGFSNVSTEKLTVSENTTVGTNNLNKENSFTIFPNPVKDVLNISYNGSDKINAINLISIDGKNILNLLENNSIDESNNITINTSSIEKGVYFLQISSNNKTSTQKVIIQ